MRPNQVLRASAQGIGASKNPRGCGGRGRQGLGHRSGRRRRHEIVELQPGFAAVVASL